MIEVKNIVKSFEDKIVLTGVNLTIEEGHILVIVGQSGCGKTVLLRSIIGLVHVDAGEILVDGEEITGLKKNRLFEIRKKFGMLFQGAALFDSMTVFGNIALPLREHTDLSETEIQAKVCEKLDVVGLSGIDDKYPSELSGGMKKRVGLARALIMEPKFVLYDEPTTGLDPIMAENINELILRTSQKLKVTSIVVTHDMVSATRIADRIAMLHSGGIVFHGDPDAFFRSDKPIIRQFLSGAAVEKKR